LIKILLERLLLEASSSFLNFRKILLSFLRQTFPSNPKCSSLELYFNFWMDFLFLGFEIRNSSSQSDSLLI